ncbi:MAG: Carboxypeptidase regulatory-like domain, partial [Thermoplasmata archaeon]|nr:Carboxypeptidase regulatory-like domain [Thermoplasmata archaeon]
LAGAEVGTTMPDGSAPRNTTSGADGAFGFDGLPPGTYFLTVRKLGFLDQQANAEVVAGVSEPAITKILLLADPSSIPYTALFQYDAFVACSFTLVTVSFAACGLAADQTNNKFLVNYRPDKAPSFVQIEAIWDSTQALGNELGLSVTALGPPQVGVNGTTGPSPIHITINETMALQHNFTGPDAADITIRLFSTALTGTDVIPEEQVHAAWAAAYPTYNETPAPGVVQAVFDADPTGLLINPFTHEDCVRYPVLFAACWGFGGVGMALEQRVTIYTHIFYGHVPPPGWTFSADGAPPDPPA